MDKKNNKKYNKAQLFNLQDIFLTTLRNYV